MSTYTVNLYNFSGATTKNVSVHWGINGQPGSTSYYTSTYPPTDNVTPNKITGITTAGDVYNLWYYQTDTGTNYPLVFNTSGEADVYILNDPTVVLPNGQDTTYYSNGTGVDSAYIIYGTEYQLANTYKFPSPYLGFSVPAVSQASMQQLTLVTSVFKDTTPTGNGGGGGGGGGGGSGTASSTNYWYWLVVAIIILIFLVLLGGGVFYLVKKNKKK